MAAMPVESRSSHDRLRDSESPCNNAEAPHKVREGTTPFRSALPITARNLTGHHLTCQRAAFRRRGDADR